VADLSKIVDELSQLTVLEAAELSKLLEEKWGVSAAAPVATKVRRETPDVLFCLVSSVLFITTSHS
jgi:ribosomal protein L7/L12